ncbi:MAG TPA: GNAT family N-acetyltransferase [Bryobacteraceae bacterium]|nr:GNAT family N-acetyltransferase [Bryobacteraceae bacterium]
MRAASVFQPLKQFLFRILGKDPEAIVVSFASGDLGLAERMFAEIQQLEPARRHVLVRPEEFADASAFRIYRLLRKRFRLNRIGLAPLLLAKDRRYRALRRAAFLLAPRKILAYNERLERHHLRLGTCIASWLFLRGVPLDRIFLRPKWLVPWKRERSVYPAEVREIEGRPLSARRRRIAVVSPYFPYPLSHGGAVRIFYLLREMAEEFDIFLFAFLDQERDEDFRPVLEHCSRLILVRKPRYREPRWSTIQPPEVHEFRSPALRAALQRGLREHKIEAIQVEYTMLAPYSVDVLVEHDVTFDLYRQVWEQPGAASLSRAWDYWRWRRFEKKWIARYRRVVVMSDRDAALLDRPNVTVIPNGVDLARFTPEIERPGARLLFIGSFRHFPNIVAYRFLTEQVWPLLTARVPDVSVTVVAGPDPLLYWRGHTGLLEIPRHDRIELLEFVADVRPLYVEANLVLVPTLVSAGTNLKVLEALAMQRAVVSTFSGCAGLGLEHGVNVWIADTPQDFAKGVETLLANRELRERIAARGREHAENHFGWGAIGARQRALLRDVLPPRVRLRAAQPSDIPEITAIQATALEASQWHAEDYLNFDCQVALLQDKIAGFVVSRRVAGPEREILNVAVHPDFRRLRIATELLRAELAHWPGAHFLEVRESNLAARRLYEGLGFQAVGARPGYYENPPETGIVMRIFS